MATFILTGRQTLDAVRGLMSKPEDRTAAVATIVEAAGGKLLHYYITTGDSDFMLVAEADAAEDFLAGVMVAGASGSVTNLKTVRAWSSGEFAKVAEKAGAIAGSYRAPGS
ncbi:GYD domain-containing protein [Nioella aestuarii]|uniref:GYD domain-containing protein n=1 Tax=Nioella aestuarii TaxID=1662864 RepID=UPI003D7F81D9